MARFGHSLTKEITPKTAHEGAECLTISDWCVRVADRDSKQGRLSAGRLSRRPHYDHFRFSQLYRTVGERAWRGTGQIEQGCGADVVVVGTLSPNSSSCACHLGETTKIPRKCFEVAYVPGEDFASLSFSSAFSDTAVVDGPASHTTRSMTLQHAPRLGGGQRDRLRPAPISIEDRQGVAWSQPVRWRQPREHAIGFDDRLGGDEKRLAGGSSPCEVVHRRRVVLVLGEAAASRQLVSRSPASAAVTRRGGRWNAEAFERGVDLGLGEDGDRLCRSGDPESGGSGESHRGARGLDFTQEPYKHAPVDAHGDDNHLFTPHSIRRAFRRGEPICGKRCDVESPDRGR